MPTSVDTLNQNRSSLGLSELFRGGLDFETPAIDVQRRLRSLDAFRGIIMFLLVAEAANVYGAVTDLAAGSIFEGIVRQFHHHPWNGLRFWDLVQPFFMFIVGVAMAFSLHKRWSRGSTWGDTFRHISVRCLILFFLGVLLHCGYSGRLVWELWNVLTQLGFTIFAAFLVFRLPIRTQLLITFGLLALTEALYRGFPIEGFDQPFTKGHNFGSWMDLVLMGKINGGGWVAINALPTTAHTIWGVLAGKVLMSGAEARRKIAVLLAAGAVGLAIGYGLDWAGITPIIKRICTSSFVLASGGWCLVTLAFMYWLVDGRGKTRWAVPFVIVGMNPIFIYMFSETVVKQWLNDFVNIFASGFLAPLQTSGGLIAVAAALASLGICWYLCYWLKKHDIFIKI